MDSTDFLEFVLDLSRKKQIVWKSVESDRYVGLCRGQSIEIWFRYPMMGDGIVSGADLAVLSAANLELSFFSGTRAMTIIQQILAENIAEFGEHRRQLDLKLQNFAKLISG